MRRLIVSNSPAQGQKRRSVTEFVEKTFSAFTKFGLPFRAARELAYLTAQLSDYWVRKHGPEFHFEVPFWLGDDDSTLIHVQWREGLYVGIYEGGKLLVSIRTSKAEFLWQVFINSGMVSGGEYPKNNDEKIKLDNIQLDKEQTPFMKSRDQHTRPFMDMMCHVMIEEDISAARLIIVGELGVIFQKWLKEYPRAEQIIRDEIKYQAGRNRLKDGQDANWQTVFLQQIVRGPTLTKWKEKYMKNIGKSAE